MADRTTHAEHAAAALIWFLLVILAHCVLPVPATPAAPPAAAAPTNATPAAAPPAAAPRPLVVIYTTPGCQPCRIAIADLTRVADVQIVKDPPAWVQHVPTLAWQIETARGREWVQHAPRHWQATTWAQEWPRVQRMLQAAAPNATIAQPPAPGQPQRPTIDHRVLRQQGQAMPPASPATPTPTPAPAPARKTAQEDMVRAMEAIAAEIRVAREEWQRAREEWQQAANASVVELRAIADSFHGPHGGRPQTPAPTQQQPGEPV